MAEVLAELVAKITADATGLDRELTKSEQSLGNWVERNKQQLKKIGVALTAIGVGITASLGMAAKAAAEEIANIQHLSIILQNVGVAYDDVKDSLEAVITATQRKTGIADNEQRDVLSRLILVTNDYQKALDLLPITLDLAAAGQMDASTAATHLGKAYLELEKGTESVSIRFGQASLQFKSMEDIQNRVRGAAEAMVNPFSVLKAEMGDMAEQIGAFLLPSLKMLLEKIIPIIDKVKEWMNEHPKLTEKLIIATAVVGGFAAVLGPLLIMLPMLIAGFATLGIVINAAFPYLGLLAGILMIVIPLMTHWESITRDLKRAWESFISFWKGVGDLLWKPIQWVIDKVMFLWGLLQRFLDWLKSLFQPEAQWHAYPTVAEPQMTGISAPQGGYGAYAKFQGGGIVRSPTLAMIGEAGPEAVIPLNELGGVVINFTQPVFFDREDTMNKFVDMIRKGIQRQDRLRFGGAWNGT